MKTVKLSEIQINAATLDGQPPLYYDLKAKGLRDDLINRNISDLNKALSTGFYSCGSATSLNFPPISGWAVMIVVSRNNLGVAQLVLSLADSNPSVFFRRLRSNDWSAWEKL